MTAESAAATSAPEVSARSAGKRRPIRRSSVGRRIRSLRFLREVAIQQLLGELLALELEQLCVRLDVPVERQADRPRPRVDRGVLERRLVPKMIRTLRDVALDDVQRRGREVARAVEPALADLPR